MHLLEKFGEKPRCFGPEGTSRPQVTGNRDLPGLCEQIVGLPYDAGDSFCGIDRQRGITAEVDLDDIRRGFARDLSNSKEVRRRAADPVSQAAEGFDVWHMARFDAG